MNANHKSDVWLLNHESDELNEICRRPTDQREVMAYALNMRVKFVVKL